MDGMSHCSMTARQSSSGRPGRDARRGVSVAALTVDIVAMDHGAKHRFRRYSGSGPGAAGRRSRGGRLQGELARSPDEVLRFRRWCLRN